MEPVALERVWRPEATVRAIAPGTTEIVATCCGVRIDGPSGVPVGDWMEKSPFIPMAADAAMTSTAANPMLSFALRARMAVCGAVATAGTGAAGGTPADGAAARRCIQPA